MREDLITRIVRLRRMMNRPILVSSRGIENTGKDWEKQHDLHCLLWFELTEEEKQEVCRR